MFSAKELFWTVIKLMAVIGVGWLIFQLRDIFITLFLVFIVTATLRPFVEYLEKFKIPRVVSALALLAIVSFGLIFLVNSIVGDVTSLYQEFSETLSSNIRSIIDDND